MRTLPPISKQSRLSVQTLREQTLQVHGAKLFNKWPWEIRNMSKGKIETFKEKLDIFLNGIPDLVPTPCNLAIGKALNSLIEWIPHLFKDLRRSKQHTGAQLNLALLQLKRTIKSLTAR